MKLLPPPWWNNYRSSLSSLAPICVCVCENIKLLPLPWWNNYRSSLSSLAPVCVCVCENIKLLPLPWWNNYRSSLSSPAPVCEHLVCGFSFCPLIYRTLSLDNLRHLSHPAKRNRNVNPHIMWTLLPQPFGPVYFQQKGVWFVWINITHVCFIEISVFNANNADQYQLPHSVASDLG